MNKQYSQVLTIGGTDSSGGAGINADIKTLENRGVYSASVVVGVTAQNTINVQAVELLPEKLISDQFKSIADDLQIKACKTGMLGDVNRVVTVAENLSKYDFGPLILDPVMIAKGGARLLQADAIEAMKKVLIPLATLITPNIPEAEELTGIKIVNQTTMRAAAQIIQELGAKNVLIKGGHLQAQKATDYLLMEDGQETIFESPRYDTKRTHGTGDTLSACIAAELAKGASLVDAILISKKYVSESIRQVIIVGHGHGPLNHWVKID